MNKSAAQQKSARKYAEICVSLKNAISILTMLCFGISRESLPERPQEINDRQTFGHLKGYCVYGKKRTKDNS